MGELMKPDLPLHRGAIDVQRATAAGVAKNILTAEATVSDVLQRKSTFVERLFPNPLQRAKAEAELSMAKNELDVLQRSLKVLRESQIQALEEAVNAALVRGKGNMRQDTLAYLMERWNDLRAALDQEFRRLSKDADEEYARAEKINHPTMRSVALARLDEFAYAFQQFSERVRRDFESILDEKIRTVAAV